jgi:pimeloyl-ACP methyl ester carboxylesterase
MTDLEFVAMQNSTSVRSHSPLAVRLARPAFAALSAVAPTLAASLAERLFLTAPRHAVRPREAEALAGARQTVVHGDDGPLTTWTWGHGPVVLLVHGWGGRGGQLAAFVPPLLANGFSVVAFDAPGHGVSPQPRSSAVAFLAAIQTIDRALGPVRGLVAHSLGAAAAARALHDGLGAEAAVFIAPPADLALYAHMSLDSLGFGRETRERMQARVEARLGVPWASLDVRGYARSMRTPLLVIHDRDDAEIPWQDGAIIAGAWPGARLSTTGGLGHRRILRERGVAEEATAFLYGFAGGVRPKAVTKNSTVSRRERSASARSGMKRTPPPLPSAALES